METGFARGGCQCGSLRYEMRVEPLIVHCCHCRTCQRETGSAFAVNAVVEASEVAILSGTVEPVATPSFSGRGTIMHRCPVCRVAVFTTYPGSGPGIHFVRVGTFDEPERFPPDIHIFTATKQPWVALPEGAASTPEFYDLGAVWTPRMRERFRAAQASVASAD